MQIEVSILVKMTIRGNNSWLKLTVRDMLLLEITHNFDFISKIYLWSCLFVVRLLLLFVNILRRETSASEC